MPFPRLPTANRRKGEGPICQKALPPRPEIRRARLGTGIEPSTTAHGQREHRMGRLSKGTGTELIGICQDFVITVRSQSPVDRLPPSAVVRGCDSVETGENRANRASCLCSLSLLCDSLPWRCPASGLARHRGISQHSVDGPLLWT